MLSRKLRTVLTAISILLGVAMVAGTFVMTDTIRNAFDDIFTKANKNTSAVIMGKTAVTSLTGQTPPLPDSVLQAARQVSQVEFAEGNISDTAKILNAKGKQIGGNGPPQLAFSLSSPRFNPLELTAGTWPASADQVVIDKRTADSQHWRPGSRIRIATKQPTRTFEVSGVARFAGVDSLGGATMAIFTPTAAQQLFDKQGKWDQISLAAKPGVSESQLVAALKDAHLPSDVPLDIKTATQNTKDNVNQIGTVLSFLTYALLAFGAIALFVGAFIIFNTFSITVAQRTRELALMRALGGTRRQVMTAVLSEALVIGVLSSLIGLGAGILLGKGLIALFAAIGIDLPHTGTVIATRTIVVALLVGIVVTLIACLAPASRATRVPPVAAMREGATLPPGRLHRFMPYIAGGIGVLSLAALAYGLLGNPGSTTARLSLVGLGCLALFIAVAMLSGHVVAPIVRAISWPFRRVRGVSGALASENAVRNPGRTATTAAALMIGLALIAFVTIFAQGLKDTANATIHSTLSADAFVSPSNFNGTLAPQVAEATAKVPGVQVVSPVATDNTRIEGHGEHVVHGIDPATLTSGYIMHWVQGGPQTLAQLGANGALLEKDVAKSTHLQPGDTFTMITPRGSHTQMVVRGIYKDSTLLSGYMIPIDTFRKAMGTNTDTYLLVSGSGTPDEVKASLKTGLTEFVGLQIQTRTDLEAQNQKNVNQIVALLYGLLALSVIISIFGIVNTLVLSIFERTREIGLLRAIGTTRWQIRRMIGYESILTAVIGALLGLVLGIFLAWIVTQALSSEGLQFSIPVGQLILFLVFAVLVGIVAAILPARRASRLDVLEALAYE
jgi:putative ABC transport system permease protein